MNKMIRGLFEKHTIPKFGPFNGRPHKNVSGEYYNPVIEDHWQTFQEAAELIVRECLDIASEVRGEPATDTHYGIGFDRACVNMISGIKEHFGVE